ncbi:putative zinc-binding metallopeptidase [uncultured Porphyromonas sp.]|uniref:zinc-binding metallopeptidase n=1 Tax=uncultured Porphyromonas sp. TaxID=159274 RepID=UPI00261A4CFB|nr:putative zinc-binding metallopeptidase [uncultured Porphyromonas sp.]
MKQILKAMSLALLLPLVGALSSCSKDTLSGATIFPTTPVARNTFERWLLKNYTHPYNIDFQYKLKDGETDLTYNLVPADSAKTAKLAMITKFLWFDAYNEVVGPDFLKESAPRIIVAVGSSAYTRQRTEVVGSAEGGYKVTLNKINALTDELLHDYSAMTEYYFHTMHHEFTHILNQRKPYNPAFDLVTQSGYVSGNWLNVSTRDAHRAGFVSPYAMMNGAEDFAEMLSFYVTYTPQAWQAILDEAGTRGANLINQKLTLIKEYTQSSWGLDLDQLRDVVIRRGGQVATLDLSKLK